MWAECFFHEENNYAICLNKANLSSSHFINIKKVHSECSTCIVLSILIRHNPFIVGFVEVEQLTMRVLGN